MAKLESHKDSVYSVSFSPNGKSLVSGSLDRSLKLWDISGLDVEGSAFPSCKATFSGHKVRSSATYFNDQLIRISCYLLRFLLMVNLLSPAPRTGLFNSGILSRVRVSLSFKATKIQVGDVGCVQALILSLSDIRCLEPSNKDSSHGIGRL